MKQKRIYKKRINSQHNEIKIKKINIYKDIEEQQEFMNNLFKSKKLQTLDDWLQITATNIRYLGGRRIIESQYKNDMKKLLLNVYPNYPWQFNSIKKKNNFKTIENQQKFMDKLFTNNNLKSFDDWLYFPREKLGSLLYDCFNGDLLKLLTTIYKNYPFTTEIPRKVSQISLQFSTKEKQIQFMEELFIKFKLKSIDDWTNISKDKIMLNGGRYLVAIYQNNMKNLLLSLYPNYPWDFTDIKISNPYEYYKSIENQREFMDKLFIKLKLNSLDDWLQRKEKILQNRGMSVFRKNNFNLSLLLQSIYPNYPFDFTKIIKVEELKSIESQRKKMDKLFIKLKLKSVEDWLNIKIKNFIKKGGCSLMYKHYRGDFKILLSTIYPNFPWNFPPTLQNTILLSRNYFQSFENQRKFMDKLFIKYKLKSLDDWLNISQFKIMKEDRGYALFRNYNQDYSLLLSKIYPHHRWNFLLLKSSLNINFTSIENQRKYMEKMFYKFQLKTINDWISILQSFILFNNENYYSDQFEINSIQIHLNDRRILYRLLSRYNNDLQNFFHSIYPNYPWQFNRDQFRTYLIQLMKNYHVTQKKDWYRIPLQLGGKFELYKILRIFYPHERWIGSYFVMRAKKTSQRLLFSFTQKIYPSLLIIEDYFHPKLTHKLELDIFIPALQLAMEYQGQHHYDDLPSGFASNESFVMRDSLKEILVSSLNIKIIKIPYWWDQSLSSLQSSLQSPHYSSPIE